MKALASVTRLLGHAQLSTHAAAGPTRNQHCQGAMYKLSSGAHRRLCEQLLFLVGLVRLQQQYPDSPHMVCKGKKTKETHRLAAADPL